MSDTICFLYVAIPQYQYTTVSRVI